MFFKKKKKQEFKLNFKLYRNDRFYQVLKIINNNNSDSQYLILYMISRNNNSLSRYLIIQSIF